MSSPESQPTWTLTAILDYIADCGATRFQNGNGTASLQISINNGVFSFTLTASQPNGTQVTVTNGNFLAACQALSNSLQRYVAPPSTLGGQ